MYEIYCDGKLMQNFDIKGLCLVNPILDLEVNKVGKFEFDIYPDHPYYNLVKKQKSIVVVKCKRKTVFRGRVLDDKSGMFNQKHVICEGEMAFLNDSIQRPYDFFTGDKHTTVSELFTFFITNHNAQVKEERQFKVGNITVVDENDYIVRKDSSYPNTWESVNKKLIDSLGGYIRVRHESDGNYIDYIDDFNTINQQSIEFGINLLDVSKDRRGSGVATAIIPLGAKLSEDEDAPRLTIESVNDGVDFIFDEDAVNEYGWILKPVEFNEVRQAENLLRKGRQFLATVNYIPESLRVTAADLAGTGLNISPFSFESYIPVISKVHDIDTVMLVSKMTIELNNPGKNEMTVGRTWKTLTGETSDMQSSNKDIVERVEKTESNIKINQGAVEDLREDTNSTIMAMKEEIGSQIDQSAESIKEAVWDKVYLKGETDQLVESISAEMEHTSQGWDYTFNKFKQDVEALANGNDAAFEEIRKYIRFIDGEILLGNSASPLELRIMNDRISFRQNGYEVAYISDRKMYNTVCEVINKLIIGDSAWVVETNAAKDTIVSLMPA